MTTSFAALAAWAAACPAARRLSFFSYAESPLIEQRTALVGEERALVDDALALRAATRLPFWDAVCVSTFGRAAPPVNVLRAASLHRPLPPTRTTVFAGNFTEQALVEAAARAGEPAAMCSSLDDAGEWHVPLLDFHIPPSDGNLAIVAACCRQLGLRGSVLVSGKSYHVYGAVPVRRAELSRLLASALLLAPIIDRAWLAHQLIEGECALRVTAKVQGGAVPTVVATL